VAALRYSSLCGEHEVLAALENDFAESHIPKLFGIVQKRNALWIAQEFAAYGNLKGAISGMCSSKFTARHKLVAAADLASAMDFLSSRRVVHADLQCKNALVFHLNEDPLATHVKLSEFGLSLLLPAGQNELEKRQPRAVRWSAPETILESKLSSSSDAWAFGATLWELFSGVAPWSSIEKRDDVADKLCWLKQVPDHGAELEMAFPKPLACPESTYRFIMMCLRVVEADRIRFTDLRRCLNKPEGEAKVFVAGAPSPTVEAHSSKSMQDDQKDEERFRGPAVEDAPTLLDPVPQSPTTEAADAEFDQQRDEFITLEDCALEQPVPEAEDSAEFEEGLRWSRLNENTGEEEYFYPDFDSAGDAASEIIRQAKDDVHSSCSTACVSKSASGSSTPALENVYESGFTKTRQALNCPRVLQALGADIAHCIRMELDTAQAQEEALRRQMLDLKQAATPPSVMRNLDRVCRSSSAQVRPSLGEPRAQLSQSRMCSDVGWYARSSSVQSWRPVSNMHLGQGLRMDLVPVAASSPRLNVMPMRRFQSGKGAFA
jgi:serine/threonine protein kinase